MGVVGVYGRLVVAGFRRQSQYRLAMLSGLSTNLVFGFLRAAVLLAAVDRAGVGWPAMTAPSSPRTSGSPRGYSGPSGCGAAGH